MTIMGKIKNRISLGPIAGLFSCLLLMLDHILLLFWSFLYPDETIEIAVDFDYKAYSKNKEAFGDHTFKVDLNQKTKADLEKEQK